MAAQASVQLTEEKINCLTRVSNRTNTFAVEMFSYLSKMKPQNNIATSPLSLQVILALAYTGASGKTAKEISTLLNLSTDMNTTLEEYRCIIGILKNRYIHHAKKVFIDSSLNLKEDFTKNSLTNFESDVEKINFRENFSEAINSVNKWVTKKTRKKIRQLISERDFGQDKDKDLVFIDAIHFKPRWKNNFSEGATCPETFYFSEEESDDIDMMFDSDKYRYLKNNDLNAQILELPCESDEFSVFILLPNEINGLQNLENSLSRVNLPKVFNQLELQMVDVTLPKFEIIDTFNFTEILTSFGIKEMFNKEEADFSGISKNKIAASLIVQKVCVQVDEEGKEETTSTGLTMATNLLSVAVEDEEDSEKFKADHPFLFVVTKIITTTSIIVLMGKFTGKLNSKKAGGK